MSVPGGKLPVQLTGSNVAEQLTQADAVAGVLTFAANIETIEIYNTDATNDGTFTVNGIDILVPAASACASRTRPTSASGCWTWRVATPRFTSRAA